MFDKKEDRNDFIQTAFLVALETAKEKGLEDRGARTYVLDIQFVVLEAKRRHLADQYGRTGSRRGEKLMPHDWSESFDKLETKSFAAMTDGMPPPANGRDWAAERSWKLHTDSGQTIFFSYEELAELRNVDRHSVIASRSRGTAMPFRVYEGKLFLGPMDIAKAAGVSMHKAKQSQKIELRWAE